MVFQIKFDNVSTTGMKANTEIILSGRFGRLIKMLAVVLAILAKLVVILKLGLRSISKRITSLIFLNIYTLPKRALTHIILFVLK